jgi:flagellar basal-body rod protein FlgG
MILEMTRPVQGGLRQERKLDTVSNNLANVDTNGYKKDVVSFDRKFKAQLNKDFSPGDLLQTGNPFDVALAGDGLFKLETPDGIQYTRDGSFTLDSEGVLVNMNGHPVLGQGGAIALDLTGTEAEGADINEIGEIRVGADLIGALDIVTFEDKDRLEKIGQNMLSYDGDPADEIPLDQPELKVKQRVVEGSNVQVVEEMVKMIDYHRMFETFTKSMQTFDELDEQAIGQVGTPIR